jgi:Uma2 family endonuclease
MLQRAILLWFYSHEKEWGIQVMQSLRIKVCQTRYRIADVVVIDRSLPIEQILTHPPVAVFEVVSPEDSMTR